MNIPPDSTPKKQNYPKDVPLRAVPEVVANCDHLARLRFSSALPHAFTEHGPIPQYFTQSVQKLCEVHEAPQASMMWGVLLLC
jgi:hypothetical protein